MAILHVRRAGFMNATKLGHWLLARARAHSVDLVRHEITGLALDNQRLVTVRLSSGARIEARAFVLVDQRRLTEAKKLLLSSFESLTGQFGAAHPRIVSVVERLVTFYDASGGREKAAEWRARLAPNPR